MTSGPGGGPRGYGTMAHSGLGGAGPPVGVICPSVRPMTRCHHRRVTAQSGESQVPALGPRAWRRRRRDGWFTRATRGHPEMLAGFSGRGRLRRGWQRGTCLCVCVFVCLCGRMWLLLLMWLFVKQRNLLNELKLNFYCVNQGGN